MIDLKGKIKTLVVTSNRGAKRIISGRSTREKGNSGSSSSEEKVGLFNKAGLIELSAASSTTIRKRASNANVHRVRQSVQ